MRPRALERWYGVHKWTSLFATANFLLLCATGLPLVFHHEIDHWLGNAAEPAVLPEGTPRTSLDGIVADALGRRPGEVVQFVYTEDDEPHLWFLGLAPTPDAAESSVYLTYDARTGNLLKEDVYGDGVMYVLWKLHVDLFAGLPGTLFLGVVGLAVVASLVSGIVVYGPFMRRLPFGAVRRERSRRTRWLDLHNLFGIATVAWVLVVSATGVVNTLARPILSYWQMTELAEMTAAFRDLPPLADNGSPQRAVDAALAREPSLELSFMAFPGNPFAGPHHYTAFLRGREPLTSRLLKPVLVAAETGEVTDSRSLPWYAVALLVSEPLHFGDYGGMPLKILWGVLDLLTIFVTVSGLYLWLARGRRRVEERLRELEQSDDDRELPAARAAG